MKETRSNPAKPLASSPPSETTSRDAAPPPWGPGFLRLNAWPYRAEYAAATIALLLIVFVWRGLLVGDLGLGGVLATIFWALFPDLAAFLPIGLRSRGSGGWPEWGPTLYNVFHSLLVWALVFVSWWIATGSVSWPLLGWAGHITADRAAGYHLRARATASAPNP